ncbi:transforming acidic coiled-coil-containing protein 3 [Echinops telfairi]|uniref:Transforming acidic coiled-coil-containing protein 3 n=1 Tax=Echinops telfairi TaxID=9371 RepID=A0AC55D0Y6_ECHTE|nr:transforming acidic coiled-coil-containing protein 3 [Echinops telfairi]
MSLQILQDENVTGDKTAENYDLLFLPPEVTGRSSVLRLSQKENVPPKNITKAVKVTFQTPLRDPQTHRILSPSMPSKLESMFSLDDAVGLENAHPTPAQRDDQQFSCEAEATPADGAFQKPALPDTAWPLGAWAPAGSSSADEGLDPACLGGLDTLASPQALGVGESPPLAGPGQVSNSPEEALQERGPSSSPERNVPLHSDTVGDIAGLVALAKSEGACGIEEEAPSDGPLVGGVLAAPVEATPPPTACPEGPPEEAPPTERPSPDGPCAPPGEEQKPQAGTVGDSVAPMAPDEARVLAPSHMGPTSPSRAQEEGPRQVAAAATSEPVKLEFDFSAGKRAPPPRKLGKRPGLKPPSKSRVAQRAPPEKGQSQGPAAAEEGSIPAPRGAYSLDWDKLDDPNFNPFGSGSQCAAAAGPPSQQVGPAVPDGSPDVHLPQVAPRMASEEGTTFSTEGSVPVSSPGSKPVVTSTEQAAREPEATPVEPKTTPAEPVTVLTEQKAEPALDLSKENFSDPAEVLGTEADVDYLEQFGTSLFKESALRKQSLYLKFDPLLKDSPSRLLPVAAETASIQATVTPASGSVPEAKLVDIDFLDVPVPSPPPGVLGPGAPPLPVGHIVDVLQYSQKDLDAAVHALQVENLELKSRCAGTLVCPSPHRKIMDEFEELARQVTEEAKKEKELAEARMQTVLKERDQLTADLDSMEKSFSDLFKRLEKQKEVIEGYHKNEESLKQCVQESILRVDKESQRYQALKAHAEEKLSRANEEIAQVRSKAQAEALAFQASLRKEQMRVHSLEKTIEQKTRENEELTRICDDLIAKMEKI